MIPNDPAILLSFVNTKLRDFYSNLDDMCDDMELVRSGAVCHQRNSDNIRRFTLISERSLSQYVH